jgi:hypothetical protein
MNVNAMLKIVGSILFNLMFVVKIKQFADVVESIRR